MSEVLESYREENGSAKPYIESEEADSPKYGWGWQLRRHATLVYDSIFGAAITATSQMTLQNILIMAFSPYSSILNFSAAAVAGICTGATIGLYKSGYYGPEAVEQKACIEKGNFERGHLKGRLKKSSGPGRI